MEDSRSTSPPLMFFEGFGRVARLTNATPSTSTRPFPGITRRTRPVFPRSLPATTRTLSSFFTNSEDIALLLEDLGGQGENLHEVLLPQLAGHRAENPGADRLAVVVDQHRRVLIEADAGAVAAPLAFVHAHDDGPHHLPLLDVAFGHGFLHRGRDDVA